MCTHTLDACNTPGWIAVFIAVLLFAGCGASAPLPSEAAVPAPLPAALETASVPAFPHVAAPVTPTTTPAALIATTTVTVTAPATATTSVLRMLTAVNIRSGPGAGNAIIGQFAADARADILAQSADNRWWQVRCPADLPDAEECWVSADRALTRVIDDSVLAVAASPTPPSLPTATVSATPCISEPPANWVAYSVQAGDTLSAIAARTGESTTYIAAVNCLPAPNEILAGASIYVPPAPQVAVDTTPPVVSGNGNGVGDVRSTLGRGSIDPARRIPVPMRIAPPFNPNRGICKPPAGAALVTEPAVVFDTEQEAGFVTVVHAGEAVRFCVLGFSRPSPQDPITLTLHLPGGVIASDVWTHPADDWRWLAPPGLELDSPHLFQVTAVQGGDSPVTGSFQLASATTPHAAFGGQRVSVGDLLDIVVGLPSGVLAPPLLLCKLTEPSPTLAFDYCLGIDDLPNPAPLHFSLNPAAAQMEPGRYRLLVGEDDTWRVTSLSQGQVLIEAE